MGLDRTYLETTTIQHHTLGPYRESPWQEEKRMFKKFLGAECRGRAAGTRYGLEQCRQSSPEPCSLIGELLLMTYVPHGTTGLSK